MKKLKVFSYNNKGSALIMVFMVLLVLLALGLGVMSLSLSSAKQTVATDTYEKLYYPAEGASTQGVDFVKAQALASYNNLATKMQGNWTPTESEFYQYINDRVLGTKFLPDQLEKETASPGSKLNGLSVNISAPGSGNPRVYTVQSIASGPSLNRTVVGKISIQYVPPIKSFQPFGNSPLIVGGSLNLANVKPNTELVIPAGIEVRYVNNAPAINDPKDAYDGSVYPLTHSTEWVLTYSKFTTLISGLTANQIPAPQNNETIKNLSKSTTWNIVGEEEASYTLDSVALGNGGTIVCSDSDSNGLIIEDCVLNRVSIICKGNITINGGSITNSNIFCGGKITIGNENAKNTTISDSIIYAKNAEVGRQGNGKTEIVAGLFYTYENLIVNGNKYGYFKGQVVTNGSTTLTDEIPNKDSMFIKDQALMDNLPYNSGIIVGSNPFAATLGDVNGGSLYTIIQPVMSDIIISQNIAEQ